MASIAKYEVTGLQFDVLDQALAHVVIAGHVEGDDLEQVVLFAAYAEENRSKDR